MAFVYEEKRFKTPPEIIPGPGDYSLNPKKLKPKNTKNIPFNSSEARFQMLSTSVENQDSALLKEINSSSQIHYIPESSSFKSKSIRFKKKEKSPGPGKYFGKGQNNRWSDNIVKKIEQEKILKEIFQEMEKKKSRKRLRKIPHIKRYKSESRLQTSGNGMMKMKSSISNKKSDFFNNSSILSTQEFRQQDEVIENKFKLENQFRPLAQGKVSGIPPYDELKYYMEEIDEKNIRAVKWKKPKPSKKHFLVNDESLGPGLYSYDENIMPFFKKKKTSSFKSGTNRNLRPIR